MLAFITRFATIFLLLATLLPLFPVGAWIVRIFDFPRVQIVTLLVFPLFGLLLWSQHGWTLEQRSYLLICLFIAVWQLSHVIEFTKVWKTELADIEGRTRSVFSVSAVNLKFENTRYEEVLAQLEALDSEILLLIEINHSWAKALAPLSSRYPYKSEAIEENGLGLALWSKLPLVEPRIRYLVSSDRASVYSKIPMEGGEHIYFIGVHPTPPGLENNKNPDRVKHDSRIRDAELILVAKQVANEKDKKWIVTGDFNDVAWSHTTRMFKRISGLKDPRVGRGLYNTYHADYLWFRFPIDQIFVSPGAKILNLSRFQPAGSDHFAITTSLSMSDFSSVRPKPEGNDLEEASKIVEEGIEDALENEGGESPTL